MKKRLLSLCLATAIIGLSQLSAQTNLLAGWDGNGVTGILSKPNDAGWLNTASASIPWSTANSSTGCRFRDSGVSGGYTAGSYTYEAGGTVNTRQLMFRWDADSYATSIYAYPVTLEACATYIFSMDFVCGGSATPPQSMNIGISTTPDATGRLKAQTINSTTSATSYRNVKYTFTTATAGTYYMTFGGARAWFGVNNLSLVKSTSKILDVNDSPISFSNAAKSATFRIGGNALPNAINISAPAGITLSMTSISGVNAQCGVEVTATYNYSQPALVKDTIVVTTDTIGGVITKKIPFTYTKPTLSIYERSIEVESNGKSYPLSISSVGNTVDSIYVYGTNGVTVAKSGYAASDFVNNTLSIDVNSTAAVGQSGKLIFKGINNIPVDSVVVAKVNPYTRYYIRQNTSQLVLGSTSAGNYPVLTAPNGLSSQKFIFRRANIDPASLIDTVYILQDSLYRAIRKSTANAWDSDFGVPSANAKWVVQNKGGSIVTLLNTVSGKVVGTDAITANSKIFVDKTWTAGNNTEWMLIDAGTSTSVSKTHAETPVVIVNNKSIRVMNADSYIVYSVQGHKVMDVRNNTSETRVNLNPGIYLVKTVNGVAKVVVQ